MYATVTRGLHRGFETGTSGCPDWSMHSASAHVAGDTYLLPSTLISFPGMLHTEGERMSVCVSEGRSALGMAATQNMKGATAHSKAALTAYTMQYDVGVGSTVSC